MNYDEKCEVFFLRRVGCLIRQVVHRRQLSESAPLPYDKNVKFSGKRFTSYFVKTMRFYSILGYGAMRDKALF